MQRVVDQISEYALYQADIPDDERCFHRHFRTKFDTLACGFKLKLLDDILYQISQHERLLDGCAGHEGKNRSRQLGCRAMENGCVTCFTWRHALLLVELQTQLLYDFAPLGQFRLADIVKLRRRDVGRVEVFGVQAVLDVRRLQRAL